VLLLALLYYMFQGETPAPGAPSTFDRIGLIMLGVFPFVIMFLVTSIAMLRERTTGTLERLLTTPLGKLDLLFGYGIAFGLMAAVQAAVAGGVAYWLLGLTTAGSSGLVIVIAIANAVLGVALGLFCSAFARTEFQAVQFLPAFLFPQLLLCGLLASRDEMSRALEVVSWALPLTYAYDALDRVTRAVYGSWLAADVTVVIVLSALALVGGALTLRRRTP
jgi:ABC-2 type transport system permease protein